MPTDDRPAVPYREVAPPPALRDSLVCVWSSRTGGAEIEQPVLPDGCVDILWINDEAPQVAGPATRAFLARVASGTMAVGARFRPGWCAGILGVDASELRDLHVPLRDVAPGLARAFDSAVADHEVIEDKVATAQALLARHLVHAPEPDGVIRGTVRWLAETRTCASTSWGARCT